MKKTLLSAISIIGFSIISQAQTVTIPDANLKSYLVGNSAINTNSDTEIQVSEAASFTGDIFASNLNISDLTGVEAFTSLTGLYVRDNSLGSIDVSANSALTFLDCQNTGISALSINNNPVLAGLVCSINTISSLDVSNNTALTAIQCGNNNLSSLDVSNNVLLSNFTCDNNSLVSLDVSNNSDLLYFVCNFNSLTSLDVSNCTVLSHLSCSGNDINSLDLSNNTALGNLFCALNNLSNLDLSANTSMIGLRCESNDLSSLNVTNGNNTNFSTFIATGNPNLSCIQVDDAAYSTANWTNIDPTASFSLDCNYLVETILVQGQGGQSTISTPAGTLQMEANAFPTYAADGTYTWSVTNGTGSASIDAGGVLTAITDGIVTVIATANDASGVTGSTDITISNQSASINDLGAKANLSIYPNPVEFQLTIDYDKEIYAIYIVDLMGKTIKNIDEPSNSIDVSDLIKGIYFLNIQTDQGISSEKFVKN